MWAFLDQSHTGILTTLRSDGWPLALPVWFVCHKERVYVRTPERSRKVARVRRDARVCFTVETGLAWADLKAVVLTGRGHVLAEGGEKELALSAIADKYESFGVPTDKVPDATIRHYATPPSVIRIDPDDQYISWDNRKLRRK
jgi:PPOX class probable F420-dependent enzyme